MRWIAFVLFFSFASFSWAQPTESGVRKGDLISAADYAAWAGRELDQGDAYEEIYQFPLSGGSYRVAYENEGEDYELIVQATIGPNAESPELDFERIRDFQRNYFEGYELIEIPELSGIGDRSVAYDLWLDGEQDGVGLIAKSRNVVLTIDLHPYSVVHYDILSERILTLLTQLASVDHNPDLGMLAEVEAANVSTEFLYRFEDFARDGDLSYDQEKLEESLADNSIPGEIYQLSYYAMLEDELALKWVLVISKNADKSGAEFMHESFGEIAENRVSDENLENWNDGSLGFGGESLEWVMTSHEEKMLMFWSPDIGFGTPQEAVDRLDPYLDALLAIDPVWGPDPPSYQEPDANDTGDNVEVEEVTTEWSEPADERDDSETEKFAESGTLAGNTLVVGSPRNWRAQRRFDGKPPGTIEKGAAYVYLREQGGSGAWSEAQRIVAPDVAGRDYFGKVVAFDGDTLFISLTEDEEPDGHLGSIMIYQRSQNGSGNWEAINTISAPGAGGDGFGAAVSIDGDTLAIGAPNTERRGSVYVFSRNAGGPDHWGQVKELFPTDDVDVIGAFGDAVQLHGDTLVVGAPTTDVDGGYDDGAAYIFSRNAGGAGNWGQIRKLTASDAGPSQAKFGNSLAIQGDTVVIGTGVHHNAAYIFSRHHGGDENWGEVKRFEDPAVKIFGHFGGVVDLDGSTIIVAASRDLFERDDGSLGMGVVYVYSRDTGGSENWGQVKRIRLPEYSIGFSVGSFVSIDGDTLVVGLAPSAVAVFSRNEGGGENWGMTTDFTLQR